MKKTPTSAKGCCSATKKSFAISAPLPPPSAPSSKKSNSLSPPHASFVATISSIQDANTTTGTLDPDSVSALSSFLSILLPLVPPESLSSHKSTDAALVLAGLLRGQNDKLSAATVRSVVKSIGFLAPLCGGEDGGAVELPLKLLLEFSIDGFYGRITPELGMLRSLKSIGCEMGW